MIARFDDPWFEAKFVKDTTARGCTYTDSIDGADGVQFWCPCGYGKPEFPLDGGRPHAVRVSFANPRGCAPVPDDAGSQGRVGKPSRWVVSGTGFHDLTLSPSIDVGCWHGHVTNGVVT